MLQTLSTRSKQFNISFAVFTKSKQDIVVLSYDRTKPDTYYTKRTVPVNGAEPFLLRFPISPEELTIHIFNKNNAAAEGSDVSFSVSKIEKLPLQAYQIGLSPETKSFVAFAEYFSENAAVLRPGFFNSNDGEFIINYLPVIVDDNGRELTTPLRIEHNSGVIEVSRKYFLNYTVPMRMVGLLHEYSHQWLNPLIGKAVEDETAADINALYIYLSLGYSRNDAAKAFLNFFKNNWHAGNEKRYLIIKQFITDFDNGKFTN